MYTHIKTRVYAKFLTYRHESQTESTNIVPPKILKSTEKYKITRNF